jgi:type IV pilus assembly protein PilM
MPVLGLDLGSNNFRAVELESDKGKYVLRSFGVYQSPKLDLQSDATSSMSEYASALKSFLQEQNFSTSDVVVGLPETNVFTRVISYPKMTAKELKSSITYEAEQYIPLPLDEVNYDFQIIEDDAGDEGKMNVLLVAAKKQVLEKYVQLVKEAGLTTKGIEPETLALQRSLYNSPSASSASIIVNMGAESTQVIVSYRGYVRFTRSVNIGGHEITKALSQSLKIDVAQAEEYKKTYGLDSSQAEGKVFEVIKPVFDTILGEINRSKTYYTTHNPSVTINKVILSGGTALMPGILFYIANNTNVEVELANPWKNILLSSKIQKDKDFLIEQGPVFVTSVGLALKEVK